MKRIGKMTVAFILTAFISVAGFPATVSARTLSTDQKADYAGQHLAYAIKLIMSEYVGGDVAVEELYEAALRGMTDILDPYSQYYSDEEFDEFVQSLSSHMTGVGISLDMDEEGNVVIYQISGDSPAQAAGLATGDKITQINGQDVTGIAAEDIVQLVRASNDSVAIQVQRGTELKSFVIEKGEIKVDTVYTRRMENLLPEAKGQDNSAIRYVYIESISDETDLDLQTQIEKLQAEGVKNVILDLRGNGGGYMDVILNIGNMLVPKGPIMHTTGYNGKKTYSSQLEKCPFEKIIVLTDNLTASAAEVLAAALQDSKAAVVVGNTSYGKGVIQQSEPLPAGGVLKLTIMEYFRPSGGKINEVGVVPDVAVDVPDYILDTVELNEDNTGAGVSNVKRILRRLGYETGDLNEVYDGKTKEAVSRFQKNHGLSADGALTEFTLSQFNQALAQSILDNDTALKKAYEMLQ